ncbi:helix-turn-helix domain-containing protein [uncultured Draconibacterium sp.]|uniref:helix-turn-helix domain-containing protein n=1 Tax=uncultured Draconibacterium sp. TaxID=1573823 RepID=UPI0025DEFA5E|nr:helix-turn-helix domain-containing protein [uncultured Draconibacterium sp.]
MQQPELGKKIAELRKLKGLTQEELVEKCKLNVRTLQRIEAGEVRPRAYTLNVLSEVLDYNFNGVSAKLPGALLLFVRNVADIINLKKHTMKKVSILSSTLLIVFLGVFMFNFRSVNKSEQALRVVVQEQNTNSIKWFNSGQVKQLMNDYASDACFYRNGHPAYCGKEEISKAIQKAVDAEAFKLTAIDLISLHVSGDVAIEKSLTTSQLSNGQFIRTINIQHWQRSNKKWMIVNDIDVLLY